MTPHKAKWNIKLFTCVRLYCNEDIQPQKQSAWNISAELRQKEDQIYQKSKQGADLYKASLLSSTFIDYIFISSLEKCVYEKTTEANK